jgi:TRAP-type C4-dicarboxylate transport system permease small subunit
MEQRPMNKEKGKLDRCLDLIHLAMAWTAAACIIFMMLAICYSVFMRYLWDKPVPSVLEISSYLMLYITFLGTAWLQRQEGHVEVDLFLGNAKPRTRAGFKAITYLGGAAVGFILAWKGSLVTIDYFRRGVTLMGILETPQFLLIAIIPIGGLLLLVEFILQIWRFSLAAAGKRSHSE